MTQQYNNFEHEIGWEDTIEKDSDRVLLPDGLYYFTVVGMERTRHTPQPGGKLPACNKAIVSIKIVANEGETELRHNLFLHSSTEGMLSAFFAAIGQKKKGEPLRMNWNTIIGTTGVCKVGTRQYNNNNYNEVKSMLYPEDVDYTKVLNQQPGQAAQPAYQQLQQPQQQNFAQQPQAGYQAGQF